jgi:hypothetical protein
MDQSEKIGLCEELTENFQTPLASPHPGEPIMDDGYPHDGNLMFGLAFFAKYPARNAMIAVTRLKIQMSVLPVFNPSIIKKIHPTT